MVSSSASQEYHDGRTARHVEYRNWSIKLGPAASFVRQRPSRRLRFTRFDAGFRSSVTLNASSKSELIKPLVIQTGWIDGGRFG